MENNTLFEQAVRNGTRFLNRNNFLLAKKAFEAALLIQTTPELLEKVELCIREVARKERKEAIKRGRKLEQKGQWTDALLCFEKAIGEEAWIATRILELQKKIELAAITKKVSMAEQGHDLEARITAYNQALALHTIADDFAQEIRIKKIYCLLRLGRYAEVTVLYAAHPPVNDRCHYYAGLAYAKVGQYCTALAQWTKIKTKEPLFVQQCLNLIPFVYRELRAVPAEQAHVSAYHNIHHLLGKMPTPDWQPYAKSLQRLAQAFLWQEEKFSELLDLLPPLSENLSISLLGVYARLYFKLAEQDASFLEKAIPLWLTAIHSESLLNSLYARQQSPEMDVLELRDRLWQQLEQLIAQKSDLPPAVSVFWQTEKRMIKSLAVLPRLEEGRPEIFPCTPEFAVLYQQSAKVLTFLQKHRGSLDDGKESFQELRAYFSPWGPSLIQMGQGKEATALATIPATDRESLADYCRQRIHWHCGIANLLRGEKQARKHLMSALPLIRTYHSYTDELMRLAFADLDMVACVELAEVLELLYPQVKEKRFCEATAHVMGLKATYLLNKTQNNTAAMKILNKAMAIYPDSVMVKTVMEQVQRQMIFDQMANALRKNNLGRAVQILQDNPDPESKEYFFTTISQWSEDIVTWEAEEQHKALHNFYDHCLHLDPNHPVTQTMGQKIQQLESL